MRLREASPPLKVVALSAHGAKTDSCQHRLPRECAVCRKSHVKLPACGRERCAWDEMTLDTHPSPRGVFLETGKHETAERLVLMRVASPGSCSRRTNTAKEEPWSSHLLGGAVGRKGRLPQLLPTEVYPETPPAHQPHTRWGPCSQDSLVTGRVRSLPILQNPQ